MDTIVNYILNISVQLKKNYTMKLFWKRIEKKKIIGTGKIHSSEMQFKTRMKKIGLSSYTRRASTSNHS